MNTLNPWRVGLALVTGSVVSSAGLVVVTWWLNPYAMDSFFHQRTWFAMLGNISIHFGLFFAASLVGLCLFGVPCWWLLHENNFRGWRSAVILGFVLPLTLFFATAMDFGRSGLTAAESAAIRGGGPQIEPHLRDWRPAAEISFSYAVLGALVGWVVWRIAYPRAAPALEADTGSGLALPAQRPER